MKLNQNVIASSRNDGGDGSGNWGHVGRIGKHGGSAPGGGKAFRLTAKSGPAMHFLSPKSIRFSSRALVREGIRKAKDDVDKQVRMWAENLEKSVNMAVKSVYDLVAEGKFDKNASNNILSDHKRGKGIHSKYGVKMHGTTEEIHNTFHKKEK